jgi:site-specific recombinase XerC
LTGNIAIGEITAQQLDQRIHRPGYSSGGNKTNYCCLHNFFLWLKRNSYLRPDAPSAMDAVESPIVMHTPPAIITVEQARESILPLMDTGDPEDVLVLVLGLFCGIRLNEIQSLRMSDVTPDENIMVRAEYSMLRKTRSMPLLPVLAAWLRPFYGRGGCLISRKGPQIRIGKLLQAAGISWKRNWLRHSYCSYRLCDTGDLMETSKEAGHSPAILATKYLKLVTKSQAEAYFALTPEACGITDWQERVAKFIALNGETHVRAAIAKKAKTAEANLLAA